MRTLQDFDLNTAQGRYQARKFGLEIPKRSPGVKQPDFWSLIDKKGPNDCWNWRGTFNAYGYGQRKQNGIPMMAHRLAYQLTTGENIQGLIAMHVCDNPACCNPNHLRFGSHADNQKDKFLKNRQAKGEKNGSSILTEEQVLEARSKYKSRIVTYKMLAQEYGVSKDTMQKAIRNIHWKHICDAPQK